jgi:hypothetical protein
MTVSEKVCEKRGSRWTSRSSKEAERAASLDFILEVSAVILKFEQSRNRIRSQQRSITWTWSVISSTLNRCYMLTNCFFL